MQRATFVALSVSALIACSKGGQKAPAQEAPFDASSKAVNEPAAAVQPAQPAEPAAQGPQLSTTDADRLGVVAEGHGLALGTELPDVTLQDGDGKPAALREVVGDGAALIVFYRGGWCPFCTLQVRQLVQAYPKFEQRGVTPVVISVDRPDEAAKTTASYYEIPFPVLSDPDLAAHQAFRVVNKVGAEDYERLKGFGIDLEQVSGRPHHAIAIPSVFLVGADGAIRWAHVDPDYKTRPSVEQLLAAIDQQRGSAH